MHAPMRIRSHYFPDDLYEHVQDYANRKGRKTSEIMREAVRTYLKAMDPKPAEPIHDLVDLDETEAA